MTPTFRTELKLVVFKAAIINLKKDFNGLHELFFGQVFLSPVDEVQLEYWALYLTRGTRLRTYLYSYSTQLAISQSESLIYSVCSGLFGLVIGILTRLCPAKIRTMD